ncbi:E3 ubiquitin ligase PARAQUAT TOLERANCE 3-like isoform X2 [Typha latifolia]|uniref:E3 ubiquitin ligase PARAQUAT TOLERANCE 3-like isoform X2 n=1 Tax=Typha latifolia TaxID=4733 RepID=UPI003C3059CA
MAVYYKFKSAKDYDSIPIEGQFISVANLKERIFESKHLGRGTDFDLMVTNAQTDEEYVDEAAMIPKNTSVLIRRVPGRPRKTIVTEPDEPKVVEDKVDVLTQSSTLIGDSSTVKYHEESEWDEFGNDLYAIPEVLPSQSNITAVDISPVDKADEDNKIKALVGASALDWNGQSQESYGAGRGYGRGMGARMTGGRGFGRSGFERKTPPAGYVCHRCKVPGHFIQHCPTNGDPNYDIRRVKPPTGIPKSMLMATPDGSYALPSGAVAVLKPNEAAFEKEIEGIPTTRPVSDLPPELRCPLCKEVMKDAVLTSKCCFRSFCDRCIRDYIITKSMCVCGATSILADDLLPNKTLRETISRILESTTSSTENAGSLVQVQDMESARPVQSKIPSPTPSVASRDGPKGLPPVEHSPEAESASGVKAANVDITSSDKKAMVIGNASEATPESTSAREPKSPEVAPVSEDVQEKLLAGEQGKKKKKKKTRLPGSASDMQWRNYQDIGAENFAGMPFAASGYNQYWHGGMPLGIEGYMAPFGGPMPYMGYTPGPFDVPFGGGIMPHDPFVAQGYMMPPHVPRDLSELAVSSMGMNMGPPVMSREEFEARKADLRRKREMERLNEREREHSRDRGPRRETREAGGASDIPPVKSKPKPQRLISEGGPLNRSDRNEQPEKASGLDRRAPPREPSRHSPHLRTSKKRSSSSSDQIEQPPEPAKPDKKQKGSVFSRISFPDPNTTSTGAGTSKKRKSSSSELPPQPPPPPPPPPPKEKSNTGLKESYDQQSVIGGGRRGSGGGYDRNSSEEEEEEYHFKRRPSRRAAEWEEEGRRHPRGSRERDHQHDRPHGSKRR